MKDLEKITLFIPELEDMIGFPQNNPYHLYDVFEHTVCAMENCNSEDFIVRLAIFFHDFGKPHCFQDDENGIRHFLGHEKISAKMTQTIMKRMGFDNKTIQDTVELVSYHDICFTNHKKFIRRWLNRMGEIQFRRLIEVKKADIKGQHPDFAEERLHIINDVERLLRDVLLEFNCFSLKDLAVNGNDLISLGLKPGEKLGILLQRLLDGVILNEINNSKEELLNYSLKLIYENKSLNTGTERNL